MKDRRRIVAFTGSMAEAGSIAVWLKGPAGSQFLAEETAAGPAEARAVAVRWAQRRGVPIHQIDLIPQ